MSDAKSEIREVSVDCCGNVYLEIVDDNGDR